MHQLDWSGYQAKKSNQETLSYPHYWPLISGKVNAEVKNPIKGTVIRKNGSKTEELALILEGSEITVGNEIGTSGWFELTDMESGLIITASGIQSEKGTIKGYIHTSDFEEKGNTDKNGNITVTIAVTGKTNSKIKIGNSATTVYGARVYDNPEDKNIVSYLPRETELEFSDRKEGYAKISKVNGDSNILFGKWVQLLDIDIVEITPEDFDKVVVLKDPVPIDEGDFIGYLGHNDSLNETWPIRECYLAGEKQRCEENKFKLEGHFELFTCDNFEDFRDKSREQAANLPETQKSLILFKRGLHLTPNSTASNNNDNTVHFQRILSTTSLQTSKNGEHVYAEIKAGNKDGKLIDGLADISKNGNNYVDPNIKQASPWEWDGFNLIEEKATIGEFADNSVRNRKMTLDEGDYTEILSALAKILPDTPTNIRNTTTLPLLTAQQLKHGLETPWTAEMIGRLVVKYESEWYADESLSKWNDLDKFYEKLRQEKEDTIKEKFKEKKEERDHLLNDLNKQYRSFIAKWPIEKENRIKPSLWWSDVVSAQQSEDRQVGKLSSNGQACHFHPVGMMCFNANNSLITMDMLSAVNPNGKEETHQEALPYLNKYALLYGLTKPKEIAHFLSQFAHESGFKPVSEDLYYTAKKMKEKFGCKRHNGDPHYNENTDTCIIGILRPKLWSETSYYEQNPENLGNYVYAKRMGNGDEASGDGYRYRGRGLIQLTGKDNYKKLKQFHNKKNPNDIQDFLANPDLIVDSIQYATESAFIYWFHIKSQLVDTAKSGTVEAVTQLVNGGQNGYSDRKKRFNRIARLLGLYEE